MIHLTIQQLSASLDGALTGPSLDLVVRHLSVCRECRDRQARLVRTDDALRRLLSQQTTDAFLEDLSMRAESWIASIAQGLPEPGPRLNTPPAPAPTIAYEPPTPPAPPVLPTPSVVHQAGWGVIGMRPTAPATPPSSDPNETRRLLEAMERAEHATLGDRVVPVLPTPETPVTGSAPAPSNDLPAWLQEQSRRAAESHLPQGPGLAQSSAPPTAPLPRETASPAWPLPQPSIEAPRPWFVPSAATTPAAMPTTPVAQEQPAPSPTSVFAVPQEHAPYAPPAMPSTIMPRPQMLPATPMPTVAAPLPPAPDPATAAAPRTTPNRYLSAQQHRALMRDANPGIHPWLAVVLVIAVGVVMVLVTLQLAPANVRERLGERVLEMLHAHSTTPVFTTKPVTPVTRVAATPKPVETTITPVQDVTPVTTPVTAVAPVTTPTPTHTPDTPRWLQTYGIVVDDKGAPIAGARVNVRDIGLTLRTDAQGRFCIAAPAGVQHVTIEATGFQTAQESILVSPNATDVRLPLNRRH